MKIINILIALTSLLTVTLSSCASSACKKAVSNVVVTALVVPYSPARTATGTF